MLDELELELALPESLLVPELEPLVSLFELELLESLFESDELLFDSGLLELEELEPPRLSVT